MNNKVIQFNKETRTKEIPELRSGDVVKIHLKIKEGSKERIQIFEGLIIAIKGGQSSSPKITVRKVSNGVGVEIILPVFGNNVEKIELIKRAKVRRAKLYYVRDLTAKQSRMKYRDLSKYVKEEESEKKEKSPVEEKKAESKEPAEEKKTEADAQKESKPEEKAEKKK